MQFGLKQLMRGFAVLAAALMLTAPQANAAGGTLRYAAVSEPAPLDVMLTTAGVTLVIGMHIYEALYTIDSHYEPQPMLAEGEKLADGGKTIAITLRQGVHFHNGKEMTSEDVVASLKRWAQFGVRGKLLLKEGSSVEATGKYEVTIKLPEPNGAWKNLLGHLEGGPAIYPAEIASKATDKPIEQTDYIGTGPYMFKEWRPNRYIEVVRFDGYNGRTNPGDGYSGERKSNFDAIRFVPVPDVGTRVSGVQAGDYDYAETISGDLYEQLSADPAVGVRKAGAPLFGLFFTNSKAGILKDNYKLRQAIQLAFGRDDALRASFGSEALWKAQGSVFPEGNFWYSPSGTEAYNANDPEKAKALAAEAGYDGTPIRLLTSTNYQTHFDQATVFVQQMAKAGINVQMNVVDWATLLKLRGQPEAWDIFITHHGGPPDPILLTFLNDGYPGWWTSPEITELKKQFTSTADLTERKAVWDKIQALYYEQVPAIKVGDAYSYDIVSPKLQNIGTPLFWPVFWNASFK
jgi:peptide/nickel transport system substrate-binding protein